MIGQRRHPEHARIAAQHAARIAAERLHRRGYGRPPTLTMARAVLASVDPSTGPDEVVSLAATLAGVSEDWVRSGDRHDSAIAARGVAALAMAVRLRMSYPEIARWVGGSVHHSACMLSAKRVARELAMDARTDHHDRRAA